MRETNVRTVGAIKGQDVRFDGRNYYVTVNGRNFAIDYKEDRVRR